MPILYPLDDLIEEPFDLNALLQESHEAFIASFNKEKNEERAPAGLPISEDEDALPASEVPDLPGWKPEPMLIGVRGQLRNISTDEVNRARRLISLNFTTVQDDEATADEKTERRKAAAVRFIKKAWANVTGFQDHRGEPIVLGAGGKWADRELGLLDANGLLLAFWKAGSYVLGLFGEERGNSGALQPTSSPKGSAAPAPSTSGSSTDVTGQAKPSGSKAPPSKVGGAPGPSSENGPISRTSSSSTTTQEAA